MYNRTMLAGVMIGVVAIMFGFFAVPGIAQEVSAVLPNDPPLDAGECAKLLATPNLPPHAQQLRDTLC